MAVTKTAVGTRMVIRMNEGLDENFDPIYRNHGWSNVKPAATDQNVFDLAEELADLSEHTTSVIRRIDENELEEGEG